MSLFRGGGDVSILTYGPAPNFTPSALQTISVAMWTVNHVADESDLATAGTEGTRAGVRQQTVEWQLMLPPDGSNLPDASLRSGAVCKVWLKLAGLGDVWHLISNTLCIFVGHVGEVGDLHRMAIRGRHGKLTEYVTEPPTLSPPASPSALPPSTGGSGGLGSDYPPTLGGL